MDSKEKESRHTDAHLTSPISLMPIVLKDVLRNKGECLPGLLSDSLLRLEINLSIPTFPQSSQNFSRLRLGGFEGGMTAYSQIDQPQTAGERRQTNFTEKDYRNINNDCHVNLSIRIKRESHSHKNPTVASPYNSLLFFSKRQTEILR